MAPTPTRQWKEVPDCFLVLKREKVLSRGYHSMQLLKAGFTGSSCSAACLEGGRGAVFKEKQRAGQTGLEKKP